jgi:hypothetical protein
MSSSREPIDVQFGDILEANLEMLRTLNVCTFPVRYNSKFYQGLLTTPTEFTKYGGPLLCI